MKSLGKVHAASVKFSLIDVDEKSLAVIRVGRGATSAYVAGPNQQSIFYIRMANQCQILTGNDIEEYNRKRR